ncbi:BPSS1780 family membrane protein [Aliikangiella maris]|uniref:BPSS1780 family membrane protein n=2 Tax=Aliikangiella maris TaxID=3162458 RepID=A0ABV3MUP3_9GAMM
MSDNLYNSPESNITPPTTGNGDSVKRPAGAGVQWLKEAVNYFGASPGVWIGSILIVGAIFIILSLIPVVSLLVNILGPVISGGYMYACHQLKKNQQFRIDFIFKGFNEKLAPLAIVGLLYLAGIIGIMICSVILFVSLGLIDKEILENLDNLQNISPDRLIPMIALPLLVAFGLMIPLLMAYWFAPALVMLRDVAPLEAMKISFRACLLNMVPFLIYGLVGFGCLLVFGIIISIIGAIISFLIIPIVIIAYLIFICIMIASVYTSFEDIFPEPEADRQEHEVESSGPDNTDSMIA